MSREYKVDKEYSFVEILRYNLRMWWLAVIMAVVCAAALGGYKYLSTRQYVENEMYENKQQIVASLFVSDYSEASVVERVGNVMKIAKSSRTYERFCKNTGYDITMDEYTQLFDVQQGEASGVASFYVTFPASAGDAALVDETIAAEFTMGILEATIQTCEEVIGISGVSILDKPYVTSEVVKLKTYTITEDDFRKGVMKALTAGVLLGIIVEVVFYTFWMLLYKKPKNAEEVREFLDTNIIDVLKAGEDNENAFKKVALYLKDDEVSCNKISCMTLQCQKKDVALKLAMSYANEQKKTLYVDLSENSGSEMTNSISAYVLGEKEGVQPAPMNEYLDAVCRNLAEEEGMDIVGNKKFQKFIEEMGERYECIVMNTPDAVKSPEAYAAAKLCNKTFVVCGRKSVKNETLYRAKNTADVNHIQIDGVLVYEL